MFFIEATQSDRDDGWVSTGTGFLVGKKDGKYLVLTAYHIVDAHCVFGECSGYVNVETFKGSGDSYRADFEKVSADYDLALLSAEYSLGLVSPLVVLDAVQETGHVVIVSHDELGYSQGWITWAYDCSWLESEQCLSYENESKPGVSGSPVINTDLMVVGIHLRSGSRGGLSSQAICKFLEGYVECVDGASLGG